MMEVNPVLTEKEHSELIKESSATKVLMCAFGPGWIKLIDHPGNDWAQVLLKKWRSPAKQPKINVKTQTKSLAEFEAVWNVRVRHATKGMVPQTCMTAKSCDLHYYTRDGIEGYYVWGMGVQPAQSQMDELFSPNPPRALLKFLKFMAKRKK